MATAANQVAEAIQAGHINRSPSPRHDLNPSTASATREPVQEFSIDDDSALRRSIESEFGIDYEDDEDEDDISISVLRPRPRSKSFPPMPDLRFEQSYLNSISKADSWGKVAWITVRDQMMMPLVQGLLYNMAILGWQSWNRHAQISGNTVGAKVRRWWYGVNNWPLPGEGARRRANLR